MHDFAITCNLVERVAQAANRQKAQRATVEVWGLSSVIHDAIAFYFSEGARGARLKEAPRDIREIEAWVRSDLRGTKLSMRSMLTTWSGGSLPFERLPGDELNIKSVELEEVL